MKLNFNKKNYSLLISLLFLVIGTIAIVTANKIYRLGTQPIAPTAPKSVPAREPAAPCRFSFSVPASTPTPTSTPTRAPTPTTTITPTPTGSLTCDQRCLALHGGNAKYLGNCEPPTWTPPGCSHIICRTPRVIDPNKTFERILIGENPQGANDCLGSQICYCYTCEEKTCSVPAPTPTPG